MSETTGTPALNEALAKLQAALPRVGKDQTAKVKSDKANYSYKYADLADVSQAVLPLLGKVGLSFTAKPTMHDGAFVLHYKLRHTSGEHDEGFYPLPDPQRTGPQQVGSAITYARRYCLCAVTGVHPDGEDDDGAAAQYAPQNAGEAFESAAPAQRPRSNGQPANGAAAPVRAAPHPTGELDPDAQQYADEAHEAQALSAVREVRQKAEAAGKLEALVRNPASGRAGVLGPFLDYHERRLADIDNALAKLMQAAKRARLDMTDLDIKVKEITGASLEEATAAQLRQAAEALRAQVSAA
jgi:ERF superfamily